MPTYQYRLNIRDPDNGNSHFVGMTDPLKQMRPFTVAGNGGCLEAQFSALTTGMDIKPRSIVTFETNTDGAGWVPRYKGIAVVPGAARSFYPSNVKLAPMKKRFYEKVIPALKVTGGDVAAMVRSVLSVAGNIPAGTVYSAAEVPDLGLSLGDRYTFGLETVGDFLDAMAAACPAVGSSPAVTWDVLPSGTIFFKRVNTSRTYTVGSGGVKVKWKEIDAEDVCTKSILLFADHIYPDSCQIMLNDVVNFFQHSYVPVPITHIFDSGSNIDAAKVIPLPFEGNFRLEQALSVTSDGFTNPSFAIDGDPNTAATYDGVTPVAIGLTSTFTSSLYIGGWVRYRFDADVEEATLRLVIIRQNGATSPGYQEIFLYNLPKTGFSVQEQLIILPLSTELGEFMTHSQIQISGIIAGATTYTSNIYELRAFTVNDVVAERIAKSYIKLPAQEAAEVIVPGIETPVTRLTLTGYGTYNVAAVEYGPDKDSADGGMQTIFKLEQADDPELTGQSSLIKQADSKATMQAIKFQRRA